LGAILLLKWFKTGVAVLWARSGFFVVFNVLFFGAVFVSALTASLMFVPAPVEEGDGVFPSLLFGDNWVLTFLSIFAINFFLSAFLVVTLPGLVFFGLSLVLLLYRAVVWGLLLAFASSYQFLVALPTVILEGEAYVIAGVAGFVLGLSWLKPKWAFKGEGLSRKDALVRGFRECFRLYVLVGFVLFVAAIAETVTLFMLL
jgi:hypothetical protein